MGIPASVFCIFTPHFRTSNQPTKLSIRLSACCVGGRTLSQARKGLEDEENFRKLAVEELAHRLKNKLATIQSIISFQLRDEPQN